MSPDCMSVSCGSWCTDRKVNTSVGAWKIVGGGIDSRGGGAALVSSGRAGELDLLGDLR